MYDYDHVAFAFSAILGHILDELIGILLQIEIVAVAAHICMKSAKSYV